MLAEHRHAYDRLITQGADPAEAAITYDWHCEACNTHTFLSAAGSQNLNHDCQPHCPPDKLHISALLAGERWNLGYAASFAGDR